MALITANHGMEAFQGQSNAENGGFRYD
jgi:hypothetical protein